MTINNIDELEYRFYQLMREKFLSKFEYNEIENISYKIWDIISKTFKAYDKRIDDISKLVEVCKKENRCLEQELENIRNDIYDFIDERKSVNRKTVKIEELDDFYNQHF